MGRKCKYQMNKFLSECLTILNFVCLGALFLCVCAIIVVVVCAFVNGFRVQFTDQGVKAMILFWAKYSKLLKLFFYSATLLVANYNLQKYIDGENVRCLSDIREKMNTREKRAIHSYLLHPEDKATNILTTTIQTGECNDLAEESSPQRGEWVIEDIDVFDYLGTIELASIMVQKGLITLDDFDCQFGYRLDNCLNNPEILRHINEPGNNYDNLKFIIALHNKKPRNS